MDAIAARDVVDLVVALVEHAGGVEPPHDVHAPVGARRSNVAADRKGDRPARAMDLVGELDAGRGRADHQHPAVLEFVGVAVLRRRHRPDLARDSAAIGGTSGYAAGAVGEDHAATTPLTFGRDDRVAGVGGAHRGHRRCWSRRAPRWSWRSR